MPLVLLSDNGSGKLINGMIVRRDQIPFSFKCIGTTGCTLSISCVRLNGPELKLVLLWNGALTRSAIGFCDALARSSDGSAAPPAPDGSAAAVPALGGIVDACFLDQLKVVVRENEGTVAEEVQFDSADDLSSLTVQCGLKPYSTPSADQPAPVSAGPVPRRRRKRIRRARDVHRSTALHPTTRQLGEYSQRSFTRPTRPATVLIQ